MASDRNLRAESDNFKCPPLKWPPLAVLVDLDRERDKHLRVFYSGSGPVRHGRRLLLDALDG